MENNLQKYHIVDEPKVKTWEGFIVNPIVILFFAVFLPLIWFPPMLGRWWIPVLWLMVNSYLLGSPSFKKELLISIFGLFLCIGILFIFGILLSSGILPDSESTDRYIIILLNAAYFLILYLVVFKQLGPYEIYNYMRENKQ